jgi:hypothetical protein
MPALAPELVLQILEAAHCPSAAYPHPDTATLSSAALVCTSWAPLAQQVLFREAVLLRTPERRTLAARTTPGLDSAGPTHALRDTKTDVTPRVSRAARLRALAAAAAPSAPTPRSYRSTQAFIEALQIDHPTPSPRAQGLASLVRSIHVFVSQPAQCACTPGTHLGGICPRPCSAASPLPTGALTERHLAVLFGRLPFLSSAHIVLDRVDAFSSLATDAMRATCNVSTLSVHVLKRPYSQFSLRTPINALGSSLLLPLDTPPPVEEPSVHAAVFQLIHALASNLDTLILDGELPRDPPPSDASPARVAGSRRTSLAGSISWSQDDTASETEPAPDCALRELVWRGRLPPSPALLAWLLSAKAQGRARVPSPRTRRSRLEVLELCYLPPPDALAELLREHVPTLRSLRLHYFETAHVDVVRELLQPSLSELVLNKRCTAASEMVLAVQARHVAVTQPCANTARALETAGERGFKRVTVVDGDRITSEQVRVACEAEGVAFESVSAMGGASLVF